MFACCGRRSRYGAHSRTFRFLSQGYNVFVTIQFNNGSSEKRELVMRSGLHRSPGVIKCG